MLLELAAAAILGANIYSKIKSEDGLDGYINKEREKTARRLSHDSSLSDREREEYKEIRDCLRQERIEQKREQKMQRFEEEQDNEWAWYLNNIDDDDE